MSAYRSNRRLDRDETHKEWSPRLGGLSSPRPRLRSDTIMPPQALDVRNVLQLDARDGACGLHASGWMLRAIHAAAWTVASRIVDYRTSHHCEPGQGRRRKVRLGGDRAVRRRRSSAHRSATLICRRAASAQGGLLSRPWVGVTCVLQGRWQPPRTCRRAGAMDRRGRAAIR